ncbi:PREDICTED: uncharacterized protein LOC108554499, partial [Eufriesea mexicana]|uniref:uncharacterized protein LOC108554499 n=1 Tax=Eufriesea mexicana TaxID=516756 RepID=UPI00083C4EB6
MDVLLQKHGAKHIYKVPEGLRELCTDISREVLRSQPADLIAFIAEYVDTLLITRENTKIAVKVVNNILLGSQAILCILYQAGFTLEQIAVAAPRIQKAFREYLDAVDTQPVQICEDPTFDDQSMISIRSILEATGATRGDAERAAIVIQAAFRGHYERMVLNEAQGKVQWQRAVTNTLDILKKAGATAAEISKATRLVKVMFPILDTLKDPISWMFTAEAEEEPLKKDERILEPVEAVQAVAWMEMMYEDSGLTLEKANEAASIIQKAYKMYRARRHCYDVQQLESTKTMVADAVIDKLHQRIFKKVTMSGNIPVEYGTRDEIIAESTKFQVSFKEKLRVTRLKKEGHFEHGEYEEGDEEQEDKSEVEDVPSTPVLKLKPKYRPVDPEIKLKTEDREEQLTEGEETEGEATETEITLEQSTTSPELQSEIESERPTDSEFEDHVEKDETVYETKKGEEEQRKEEEDEEEE